MPENNLSNLEELEGQKIVLKSYEKAVTEPFADDAQQLGGSFASVLILGAIIAAMWIGVFILFVARS